MVNGDDFDLPSQEVRVEERRSEVQVRATWKPARKVSRRRRSPRAVDHPRDRRIRKRRSFAYPKPSLLAAYAVQPKTDVRLRVERQVSQLDFTDFVTSAAVETRVIDAGNPDLEPQRTWRIQPAIERRFAGKGRGGPHLHARGDRRRHRPAAVGRLYDAPGKSARPAAMSSTRADGPLRPHRRDRRAAEDRFRLALVGGAGPGDRRAAADLRRDAFTGKVAYTHDIPRWGATSGLGDAGLAPRPLPAARDQLVANRTRLSAYVDYRMAPQLQLHVKPRPASARPSGGAPCSTRRTTGAIVGSRSGARPTTPRCRSSSVGV